MYIAIACVVLLIISHIAAYFIGKSKGSLIEQKKSTDEQIKGMEVRDEIDNIDDVDDPTSYL